MSSETFLENNNRTISNCSYGINNRWDYIVFAVVMVFILVASVIGNSLVLVATYSSRQLRSRVNIYFIASLAVSDMCVAIVTIPVKISETLHRREQALFCHSLAYCYWYNIGDVFFTVSTILSLFFIASDRFVAIRFPFKHSFAFTVHRVKSMVLGIWLFSAIWAILGIFQWKKPSGTQESLFSIIVKNEWCHNQNDWFYIISFLGIYITPLCIMTFMYFMILKIALTQIRAIESTAVHTNNYSDGKSLETDSNRNIDYEAKAKTDKEKRIRKREIRATRSVAIVYVAFLVCWLPTCVISILITFIPDLYKKVSFMNRHAAGFINYGLLQLLPALHTMINPIIYSFSNKQFRVVFQQLFCKLARIQRKHTMRLENETDFMKASRLSIHSENTITIDAFTLKEI